MSASSSVAHASYEALNDRNRSKSASRTLPTRLRDTARRVTQCGQNQSFDRDGLIIANRTASLSLFISNQDERSADCNRLMRTSLHDYLAAIDFPWYWSRASLEKRFGIRQHAAYNRGVVEIPTPRPFVRGLLWPLSTTVLPEYSTVMPATEFSGSSYFPLRGQLLAVHRPLNPRKSGFGGPRNISWALSISYGVVRRVDRAAVVAIRSRPRWRPYSFLTRTEIVHDLRRWICRRGAHSQS